MSHQPALLIPLACAVAYVVGALAVKRAALLGVDVWRTSFLSNWAIALLFLPGWFWPGSAGHAAADYAQPALAALFFLGGQAFTFLALIRGDVSVITPVMGTKVILVALGSSLLRVGVVPVQWWIGAALSTTAIVLLHIGPGSRPRAVGRTVALAFCSALSFSLGDICIQKWLPVWGATGFFAPMFLGAGLLSFVFVPCFRAPLRAMDGAAWRWGGSAAGLLALNNAGIVLAIGLVGSATAVNIIYSARGLFSVVLVWLIGHWFRSEEGRQEGAVLRLRFAGAALMVAAMVLVLV